jgi:hypothetical protein
VLNEDDGRMSKHVLAVDITIIFLFTIYINNDIRTIIAFDMDEYDAIDSRT